MLKKRLSSVKDFLNWGNTPLAWRKLQGFVSTGSGHANTPISEQVEVSLSLNCAKQEFSPQFSKE